MMGKRSKIRVLDWSNEATREARAKLAAAGALSTAWKLSDNDRLAHIPRGWMELVGQTAALTGNRFWKAIANGEHKIFRLPPGSPTLDELQNWTRGER